MEDHLNEDNEIVGLDKELELIRDRLIWGFQLHLEAVSIVGMAGTGKTTLARKLFNDPSVVKNFHIRLWLNVSQEYQAGNLLTSLLTGLNYVKDPTLSDEDVGEILYRTLKSRRYLIVMNDVWSREAIDEVRMYLPNDKNRSRILLTSQITKVATYLNSEVSHHMNSLNLEDGWKLLQQKLFGKENFPLELEKIGKEIVKECQGHPLAIVVVAGVLCKISRTPECWNKVAEGLASHLSEDLKECLDIIGLSYNHLPSHLKACFLYLGAFPADFEIPSQRLIRLWIAEGFLDNLEIENSEKVAEEWLKDLMERHLVLVRKESLGRIKTCHMHDLLRNFCLREAKSQNFLHHYPDASHEAPQYPTRVILHSCDSSFNLSTPHIHSLLCYQNLSQDFFVRHKGLKLLTVLDFYISHFPHFPLEIVQLVNLRYLALSISGGLPLSISNFQKLQVLLLNYGLQETTLPQQIWNLSQLRYLQFNDICFLPDPGVTESSGNSLLGFSNLHTLSKLSLSSCTLCVINAIPKLKKLRICETEESYKIENFWYSYYLDSDNYGSISTVNNLWSNLDNVAKLHQLETLKLVFLNTFAREPPWIPHLDLFPPNIKKLTLSFSCLPWEYMNILCMLPNLEVLKLKTYAFMGKKWEQHEDGFKRLKLLLIESTDLVDWISASDHFPCLEHLVLRFCKLLKSIPLDFWEIHTLKMIEVHECSHSASESAKKIQLEQQSLGNDVRISTTDVVPDLDDEQHQVPLWDSL